MRRSNNDFGSYIFLIVCVVIAIKSLIDFIREPSYDSFFWFLLGLWWLWLLLFIWLYEKLGDFFEQIKKRFEPCIHGVKGGSTRQLCEDCKHEERQLRNFKLQSATNKAEREKFIRNNDKVKSELEKKVVEKLKTEISYYRSMDPYKFESEVASLYRKEGYTAEVTSKSNDEGKDIILRKNDEVTYVECKRFNEENRVSRPVLNKLLGVMAADGVKKGIVVTTSGFTKDAIEFALKMDGRIELVDSHNLMSKINLGLKMTDLTQKYDQYCTSDIYTEGPDSETLNWLQSKRIDFCHKPCGNLMKVSFQDDIVVCSNNHKNSTLTSKIYDKLTSDKDMIKGHFCPECGGKLVKKKQSNSNRTFWGCSNFPTCRYTRNIK
jgi:hypothetical protein